MSQNNKYRNLNILLLVVFTSVAFLLVIYRTYQLSIAKTSNGVDLATYYEDNSKGSSITSAVRGTIFDRSGRPIAMDTTSYSLFAILQGGEGVEKVQDPDKTAEILAQHIDMPRDAIVKTLTKSDAYQVEFGTAGNHLSKAERDAIAAYHLPGIQFREESKRIYVNDFYAPHLIGYTNVDEALSKNLPVNIQEGQMGVEAMFNEDLSGLKNYQKAREKGETPDYLTGTNVYLTLDSRIQNRLDEILAQTYRTYSPDQVMGYVVEVQTGRILAASQQPTFNLNTREGIEKEWKNLMVEDVYEPGSTIKILTLASAKDLKVYNPEEKFMSGQIKVYDQIVKDYNEVGWGQISYDEGLIRSSNVAMVNLVEKMGLGRWKQQLAKFGFGKPTGSGLPNEATGFTDFDNPVNATMSAFGQGLSVTPLQLMQAFTAIANGGEMIKLQFVDGVGSPNQFQRQSLGRIFSEKSTREILDLMVRTVEEPYGTAIYFKQPTMKIAAKTGTAQIANPDGNGYMTGPNDYYFSVVTFFPADQPKYMVYLAVKRPVDNHQKMGVQIVAEMFNALFQNIMLGE